MKILQALFLYITLIFLTSCAVPFEEVMENYSHAISCCNEISKINFEKIILRDNRVSFKIDNQSKYFNFKTGGSYFKAYELPEKSEHYFLKITSYLLGQSHTQPYGFLPYIIILDKNFRITRKVGHEIFSLIKPSYTEVMEETWAQMLAYQGTILINKDHDQERYIIILTTEAIIGKQITREVYPISPLYPIAVLFLMGPNFYTQQIKFSPIGHIRLTIIGPSDLYSSIPSSNTNVPYKGEMITIIAPQDTGYHFVNNSRKIMGYHEDNFSLVKSSDKGILSTAFVQSYRLGSLYVSSDVNKMLMQVSTNALSEHQENLSGFEYNESDMKVGPARCKRVDFKGKHKGFSPSLSFGYDIHCIHPEWTQGDNIYVVRIGANCFPGWEQLEKLPNELESFYLNVTFSSNENK